MGREKISKYGKKKHKRLKLNMHFFVTFYILHSTTQLVVELQNKV
jgi:hypothetical protein